MAAEIKVVFASVITTNLEGGKEMMYHVQTCEHEHFVVDATLNGIRHACQLYTKRKRMEGKPLQDIRFCYTPIRQWQIAGLINHLNSKLNREFQKPTHKFPVEKQTDDTITT